MKLMQVRPGKVLHLPPMLVNRQRGARRIWLTEGQTVDFDDLHLKHCCVGQEYKLMDAEAGKTLSKEARHPLVEAYRKELAGGNVKPNPTKTAAVAAAEKEGVLPTGAADPDLTPNKKPAPEQTTLVGTEPEPDLDPVPKKRK